MFSKQKHDEAWSDPKKLIEGYYNKTPLLKKVWPDFDSLWTWVNTPGAMDGDISTLKSETGKMPLEILKRGDLFMLNSYVHDRS